MIEKKVKQLWNYKRKLFLQDAKNIMNICNSNVVKQAMQKWLDCSEDFNESKSQGLFLINILEDAIIDNENPPNDNSLIADYYRILKNRNFIINVSFSNEIKKSENESTLTDMRRAMLMWDIKDFAERTTCDWIKFTAYDWLKVWDELYESDKFGSELIRAIDISKKYNIDKKIDNPELPKFTSLLENRDLFIKKENSDSELFTHAMNNAAFITKSISKENKANNLDFDFNKEFIYALDLVTELERKIARADVIAVARRTPHDVVRKAMDDWADKFDDIEGSKAAGAELIATLDASIKYHEKKRDNHEIISDYKHLLSYRNLYVKKTYSDYGDNVTINYLREALKNDARSLSCRTSCNGITKMSREWLSVADDYKMSSVAGDILAAKLMDGLQYRYSIKDGHPWNPEYERIQAHRRLFAKKTDYAYMQEVTYDLNRCLLACYAIDLMDDMDCELLAESVLCWIRSFFDVQKSKDGAKSLEIYLKQELKKNKDLFEYEYLLQNKSLFEKVPYGESTDNCSGIDGIIDFRRAMLCVDLNDVVKRSNDKEIKKAAKSYLQTANDSNKSQKTSEVLKSVLKKVIDDGSEDCDLYDDYRRVYAYRDLFIKKTTQEYIIFYNSIFTKEKDIRITSESTISEWKELFEYIEYEKFN